MSSAAMTPWLIVPLRIGVGLLAIYLLIVVVMYFAQRSLLFQPTVVDPASYPQQVAARFGAGASIVPEFAAIELTPAGESAAETAIVFHGNAGAALDRGLLATQLLARGIRVVLAEYPGYGPRAGSPSERAFVADGVRLYDAIAAKYPDDGLLLVGESLGSGVVGQMLTRPLARAPTRVVLITPFVSAAETAARIYPYLPVRLLIRDPLEVLPGLGRYRGAVQVLIAGADEVVGAAQGRAVADYARSRGATTVVELDGARHNEWLLRADGDAWDRLSGRSRADPRPGG